MKEYYFADNEQIHKGGRVMIIMDIQADNLYAFKNFHMNMSYPKKIVDSTVPEEHLKERPNFRYKKVNILMGGNATGKTSLGKLLMLFANYFKDGGYKRFVDVIDDRKKTALLCVDFVAEQDSLYRFRLDIKPETDGDYNQQNIRISIYYTKINKKDNYESCAARMNNFDCQKILYNKIDTSGWLFSYPYDARENKTYYTIENDDRYLYILERILKTLDPSIKKVIRVQELEHTYAIMLNNQSVIIKDGQVADIGVLSSGTKAGLDISYIITSLMCNKHDLYYCDELFSYVNSDVEKACLSIMIDQLTSGKQLFFTTHNTEILDMQLPKHSYTFLRKDVNDANTPVKCISASDYLKRNTDSLKHAVENDLFCTAPELDKLYEIAYL